MIGGGYSLTFYYIFCASSYCFILSKLANSSSLILAYSASFASASFASASFASVSFALISSSVSLLLASKIYFIFDSSLALIWA